MAPGARHPGTWLLVAALAGISLVATVDALRGGKEAAPSAGRQAAPGVDENTAEEAAVAAPTRAGTDLIEVPLGRRITVTEKGVTFSFRARTAGWPSWERFRSRSTDRSPGGPISLNKSIAGAQDAEAIIYWTSFPNGDYADACTRLLSPPVGPSVSALAGAVIEGAWHDARHGAVGRHSGRAPGEVRAAHGPRGPRRQAGVLLRLARLSMGALWPTTRVGDTVRVWIVDVDRVRLFIAAATTTEEASPELEKEIQQIIRSIRFDRADAHRE